MVVWTTVGNAAPLDTPSLTAYLPRVLRKQYITQNMKPSAECQRLFAIPGPTYPAAYSNEWGRKPEPAARALILYSGKLPGGKRCCRAGSNFNEHTYILLLFLRPGFVLSNQVPRVNQTEVFLKTEIDKEEMNRGRLMFPFIFMEARHD